MLRQEGKSGPAPSKSHQKTPSTGGSASATPGRPKRSQVAKACDWCRAHRIKCDDSYPCDNCKNRGGLCNNNGSSRNEVRTLPNAIRQIESLRLKIRDLEKQLGDPNRSAPGGGRSSIPSPPESSAGAQSPSGLDPLGEHGGRKMQWEGILTSVTRYDQHQSYGPSSAHYFGSRMTSYLAHAFQEPYHEHQLQLSSARTSFSSPTTRRRNSCLDDLVEVDSTPTGGEYLTEAQEDFFLGLFWRSYHCIYHIIDEAEFWEHYRSRRVIPGAPRKPSALVDIVLATCMQYGVAFLPRCEVNADPRSDIDSNDATIAGRWFYQRCQSLLTADMENPSITTIQCLICSAIYLCNASFQNTAHSILGIAVRTAQTLGLHLEPPEEMPRVQRESRKRLWWTLYALESQECMSLGRPWAAQISRVTCVLPADDHELAKLSEAHFAEVGDGSSSSGSVTCLSFILQNIKLTLAVRAIHTAFYARCADVLGANDSKDLYSNPQLLESCAGFLQSSMRCLQSWLNELPDELKTERKGSGTPMSTDRSALDMKPLTPPWLQRQRLLLELRYHTLAMDLYRPFINFASSVPVAGSVRQSHDQQQQQQPLAEANSIACLDHAMALTYILHQVLAETDVLGGWHEAFRWQWNAALSLLGFVLACPVHPCTPTARRAIASAVSVFETFGDNFAVAANAAMLTREVAAKADMLIGRFRIGGSGGATTPLPPSFKTSVSLPESVSGSRRDSFHSFASSPEPQSNWQLQQGGPAVFTQLGGQGIADDGEAMAMMMELQTDFAAMPDLSNLSKQFWDGGDSMLDLLTFAQDC